ncbi:MAG TPA: arabinofuranosidase catalytic domain-containing protein [Solirubrobacteraceae bacterium]|nr:arabinofuranosidase catalytic domain-containing protein [Solirubrobacteraceae bacterium]
MVRSVGRVRRAVIAAVAAVAAVAGVFSIAASAPAAAAKAPSARPQGPCDIYAAGGTPCVAAHSTTRALYASYDGPLYQVRRASDGRTRNIGVVRATRTDPGGYADAAAQDAFCASTTCVITKIYDQSPEHNDLTQAPRGNFSGPALGGQNNLPIATMAPVTLSGHKVYGAYIEPGMGLRDNDTNGIAVDDQPEGMYMVVDGTHFNDGCCFDYGNAEIDSHDDGDGTMETSYFGNATAWFHGPGTGPWVMTDQENNLVGCSNYPSASKICQNLPNVEFRFTTAVAKGDSTAPGTLGNWEAQAGNAQQGPLATMFSGQRAGPTYAPMRKQGAIVLGNGGDNSNGAQGTFYEGVMTRGFPSDATDAAVQANIVAARYNVQQLSLTPASAVNAPPGLQTFTPGSSQRSTLTFTNTSSSTIKRVRLHLSVPAGWKSRPVGSDTVGSVAPGGTASATFNVTAGQRSFNGDLTGDARWHSRGAGNQSATATEAVRDTDPIVVNEFRVGTAGNATNSFIELYNSGHTTVNLSSWSLTEHAATQPVDSTITIPPGTSLAAGKTYLLGLSASGLATPVKAGASTISLRSTTGLKVGDKIQIGAGADAETRTITAITSGGATGPRVPGKIGKALQLNGDGEYAQLPNGIVSGLHDFTISTWVNPSANLPWSRIFDFGTGTGDFMFMTLSAGGGPLIFSDTNPAGVVQTLFAPGQLPLNTWSHVAVTLSGTTGTLYIDGKAVDTNTNMTTTPADLGVTTQNWIGHSQFVADPFLDATVDDFQIYSRALSAGEIAALAAGQPGAGNVADYKFDEAGGPTAIDSSGNGNDATIFGVGEVSTPLWQPLPDGPITIPRGATNVPVTSTSGFAAGQKISLGFGQHEETGTVTNVGTSGDQAYLAAPAPAGDTVIKVTSTAGITAGAKINLDIGSRRETVTVASVGTAGANGTGITLTSPLKFSHSSNLPFSARGTGISFKPATRFAHSSDEPVRALMSSITLGRPLSHSHGIDTAVVDSAVTNAGYQGPPEPDLWFGGPTLSTEGTMVLRNAWGQAVDSLNYGGIVDPANQEGYQGASGTGRAGCFAPTPPTGRSTARDPDGSNTDSNCADFFVSPTPTPGASNQIPLQPGPLVSLESAAPGATNQFVTHDDTDDGVVTSTVTAASSEQAKADSTFVETKGNANPSCVSFESINRPGEFLRHQNFVLHLQPDDGSSLFANDSTFCPHAGNNGHGTSFESVNFPGRFLRMFGGGMYLAGDGINTGNPWDTAIGWTDDTSWLARPPLASTSQPMTSEGSPSLMSQASAASAR